MTLSEIIQPEKLDNIEKGWHCNPGQALWEIVTTLRIILFPMTDGSWLGYLPIEYGLGGVKVNMGDPQAVVLEVCRVLLATKGDDYEIPVGVAKG